MFGMPDLVCFCLAVSKMPLSNMHIIKMFKHNKQCSKSYFPCVEINIVQKKLKIRENRMKAKWFSVLCNCPFPFGCIKQAWVFECWNLHFLIESWALYVNSRCLVELLSSKTLVEMELFRYGGKSVYHKDLSLLTSLWSQTHFLKDDLFLTLTCQLCLGSPDVCFLWISTPYKNKKD